MSSWRPFRTLTAIGAAALGLLCGCERGRDIRDQTPTYLRDVASLLESRCAECHSGEEAEAGYRVDSYLDAIGCLPTTDEAAVLPADETAPILRVLDDEDHLGLVTEEERLTLLGWVIAGSPNRHGASHDVGFDNPRSPQFHGRVLREGRWARMLTSEADDACGRCHPGAPATAEGFRPPPEAPDCRSCHDGPDGVLSCDTCHGFDGHAYPASRPCFLLESEELVGGAHAVHVDGGELGGPTLDCTACHPERSTDELADGAHGDGVVDVELDPTIAGEDASYSAQDQQCTVACHDLGGVNSRPSWLDEGPMECDSCHLAPPEDHNPAGCDRCHSEVNEDGTELTPGPLHLNGVADVGLGTEGCGQCHGDGEDDPWPDSERHPNHREPEIAGPVECETCHVVPEEVDDEGHIDDETEGAEVIFSGLAGDDAFYDSALQQCGVACHDLGGVLSQPTWLDEGPLECDSCHLAPPEDHNPATCDTCHADAEPEGDELRVIGRHVNGVVDWSDDDERCGSCHGEGDDPWPDTERHPNHRDPLLGVALACETCHVVPEAVDDVGHIDDDTLGAEVIFSGLAGDGAVYDRDLQSCSVACHDLGGALPRPAWTDLGPLGCGDCHQSPPAGHNPASCDTCHGDAEPGGDGLRSIARHVDGVRDLGDGSGQCGACHGQGDDPGPRNGRHAAHLAPSQSAPVACATCHVVPSAVGDAGHLDATLGAEVVLSGLAAARGAMPSYSDRSCSDVACHGARLPGFTAPSVSWDDESGAAARCGACHGLPPSPPHTVQSTCESLLCHGGEVARWPEGLRITEAGRAPHVNGDVDHAGGTP